MFKTNRIKFFLGTTKFEGIKKVCGALPPNSPAPGATGLVPWVH